MHVVYLPHSKAEEEVYEKSIHKLHESQTSTVTKSNSYWMSITDTAIIALNDLTSATLNELLD